MWGRKFIGGWTVQPPGQGDKMHEQEMYVVDLSELFPDSEGPIIAQGTAGELMEKIADEFGLEDEDNAVDIDLDSVYPSTRAFRAHQVLEDRLGKSGVFDIPDMLVEVLIKEGLLRSISDEEYDDWADEEEMDEYDDARSDLDEEWSDGVWET